MPPDPGKDKQHTRARLLPNTEHYCTVLYSTILPEALVVRPKHNWAELQQSLLEVQRCRLTGQLSVLYCTALRHVCTVQCTGNSGAVMCCCGSCSTILLQYSTVQETRCPKTYANCSPPVHFCHTNVQETHYSTVLHAAAVERKNLKTKPCELPTRCSAARKGLGEVHQSQENL